MHGEGVRVGLLLRGRTNGNRDTYPNLYAENVMGCATQLRILTNITMQIEMVDARKVLQKVLSHSIESKLIDEAVIADKANDPIAIL
jgi:hypothetical protein